MKKTVLGIKIDDIDMDQSLQKIAGWLLESGPPASLCEALRAGKHYIVTPNPELIVIAQKDQDLKVIINNADLAIPDGIGLKLSGDIVCHTPGIDLMERIIKLAEEKGYTTGFLGGKNQVAKKSAERLQKKYPNLKITFAESGGEVDNNGNVIASPLPLLAMKRSVDILFVAFGQPKQEKWIAKNLDKIPVKVAMGVGGSFDYISGAVPRAPVIVRRIGGEWLFRLIIQPWRIKRQLVLIKFILMLLWKRLSPGKRL